MNRTALTEETKTNKKSESALPLEKDILLPLPPADMEAKDDMAIYARFMRHLRHVPGSRKEIKILSAIQFTADMLDYSDAHIAKMLVEMGLRAPRIAFPSEFLSFTDKALKRGGWEVGAPNIHLLELKKYWDFIGENKYAAFKGNTASLLGTASVTSTQKH